MLPSYLGPVSQPRLFAPLLRAEQKTEAAAAALIVQLLARRAARNE